MNIVNRIFLPKTWFRLFLQKKSHAALSFRREAVRVNILAKILMLTLGLALLPLVLVGWLSLSSLANARDMVIAESDASLRSYVEQSLADRARDKARLYNRIFIDLEQHVEMTGRYAELAIVTGQLPYPPGRVWVAPDGPDEENLRQYGIAVSRAQELQPLIEEAVANNPLVDRGYVAFEEGGVIAYNDEAVVDRLHTVAPFDPRAENWYRAAADQAGVVWTDVYESTMTGDLIVTCAVPLYSRSDELLGVIGFDLGMQTLQQHILATDIAENGFAFLVNSEGDILVRPDPLSSASRWGEPFQADNLVQSSNEELRSLGEQMLNLHTTIGNVGVEAFSYEDTRAFVAFAPIEAAGWSLALVVPEEEIIQQPIEAIQTRIESGQATLSQQLTMLLIGIFVLVCLIGFWMAHSLTRPIRALQRGAQRVADGQLDYQLPPAGHDEIGRLVELFNAMTHSLREKISELEEQAHQLAMLNMVSNRFRSIFSLTSLYQAIPHAVCEHFPFERATFYLVDSKRVYPVGAAQRTPDGAQALMLPKPNDGETLTAATERESNMQMPVFGQNGRMIGLIVAESLRPLVVRDTNQMLMFATMVGLAMANVELYSDLERKVAQRTEELREALERAQRADRRKSEFLASISHELRTPLNAIIGFSTVLLDEPASKSGADISADQREDIESIHRNGQALLHLINELLDLARIEAGRLEIARAPLDLHVLTNEVINTAQGLLEGREVTLQSHIPPDLPPILGDAKRMRQVMLNLLANAIKFTEHGSVIISAEPVADEHGVELHRAHTVGETQSASPETRQSASCVAVSVRDTGVGIPASQLEWVFEEFSQVHDQRSREKGTGLGLAIARRLVEAHHGRIWVESVPGQGSTFTFTLPIAAEADQDIP
jgi:two-component system sensor histidine kinase/response regulator